jgi:P27 family predicted phage terminase small subunit
MAEKMKAPKHLQPATRRWWATVVADFELEPHHVRLLTLAGESWDRGQQAREAIAEHGLTFTDRHGSPRARPEVGIERDSRIAFARLLRELALDIQPPSECRSPAIVANAFRKVGGN